MTEYSAPGGTVPLTLNVFTDSNGALANATSLQLDITYGSLFDGTSADDFAGPFSFTGAETPTPGEIYQTATGVYEFDWSIPASAYPGVYVANWTGVYGGDTFLTTENIVVQGNPTTPVTSGDLGFWTGTLTYGDVQIPLGGQDANGTTWTILDLQGFDGVDTVGKVSQRAGDHGGLATPQYYAPRVMTLIVQASAATQALRDTARAMLQQAVPISDLATFVYDEPITKTLMVRRSGKLLEKCPTLVDCVFTIGLVAPDPRKYGSAHAVTVIANEQMLGIVSPFSTPITSPAQQPPGVVTITNDGNFETRPTISISGPIIAPQVYNQSTGQLIGFSNLALGSSDTLVLDLLNQVAALDGGYTPADLSSSWWVLQPGTDQVILEGESATGAQMTISYNDAWM